MAGDTSRINLNATGAPQALPGAEPRMPGRESHERDAALHRGESLRFVDAQPICAPDLPGLSAGLLYTLVAENVRDYAIS